MLRSCYREIDIAVCCDNIRERLAEKRVEKLKNKQTGCMPLLVVWGAATLISGLGLNSINEKGIGLSDIIFMSLMLGAMITFVGLCFSIVVYTSRANKLARQQQQKDKAEGISRYDNMIHIGGLNAPEYCKCKAVLNPDTLVIECGGTEFLLNIAKIRNVYFQIDVDEKQYLKSSMVSSLAGVALFGVSGAIIGALPKTKTRREVKGYAFISYEDKQGCFRTFVLRDEIANLSRCAVLVDTLKPMINEYGNRVEL